MGSTRAGRYGQNLAIWISDTLNTKTASLSEKQGKTYRARFLNELKSYSLEPRKAGQPRNSGCVHELSDISVVNIDNPEQFARLIKEGIHLMYQKQTSARVLEALLKYL